MISAHFWNTFVTLGSVHFWLPAQSSVWKSYPFIRRLRMSKVPIAGQPSLSAKAIGVRPSFFIWSQSFLKSSQLVGI